MKKIYDDAALRMSASGDKVVEIITNNLFHIEINRRVDLVTTGMRLVEKLEKDLNRINRPDNKVYDASGNTVETTSQARWEEIKKLKEKLDHVTKVVNSALTDNTSEAYNKLTDVIAKNKPGDGGDNKKEGSGESK
jgi:hypothetical protein